MTVIVTGVAGFIGFHVTKKLCESGVNVIGIDNVNDYYDINLKQARLAQLKKFEEESSFEFFKLNIADHETLVSALENRYEDIKGIIHLAAQAGVRYSLDHPFKYAESNMVGHLSMLELARMLPNLEHLVYASSSSVYGGNTELPYSVEHRTDKPISLYAATKKSAELISYSYSHLYRIPMTGLRFFTVYGPWGRPDMAYYMFTKAIINEEPIKVFGKGKLKRDFTYIDDIVSGVISAFNHAPTDSTINNRVYNLGNDKSEDVNTLIEIIEEAVGKKAIKEYLPMQPGDMKETHADISQSKQDLAYEPNTSIMQGLPKFVNWYKGYSG